MIIIFGSSGGIGSYLKTKYPQAFCPSHKEVDISDHVSLNYWCFDLKDNENYSIINCVGITDLSFIHKSNYSNWLGTIYTNLIGTYNIMHRFLPIMREQKYGNIINFSSVVVDHPVMGSSAYCASKMAIEGLCKTAQLENEKYNIKIEAIKVPYLNVGLGEKYKSPSGEVEDVDVVYQQVKKIIER